MVRLKPRHIGMVVPDLDASIAAASRPLGLGPFRVIGPEAFQAPQYFEKKYRGVGEDFAFRCAHADLGASEIELIQPVKGRTVYEEFLRQHGEGLHRIAVEVVDLDATVAALEGEGGVVVQSGRRTGLQWAYVEIGALNGLIVELMQPTT